MAEAESILTLDASDFVSGAEEADSSMENLSDESENTQSSLLDFENAGSVAAGAITGVGGAITGVTEGSKDWRESLGRTRVDLGLTQTETENLANSIGNATFPMDDVTATMDSLAQQGITTKDTMMEVATGSDNMADATGQTAESIATNLGPAMTSLGDDLEDLPSKQDSFTKAMRTTMLDAPQFSKALQQSSESLNAMGLNSSESADLLGAFAEETGLTGRELRRRFREELEGAEGDLSTFKQQTGITNQELKNYKSEITDSGQLTSEYSGAANESLTVMDDFTNFVDEMTLGLGGLLEPINALGPVLMGLGGALFAASAAGFTASGAMTALGIATSVLLGPVGLIIAAIALLAAAFATDFMGIRTITMDVIGAIVGRIQDFVNFIKPFVQEFLGVLITEFTKTFNAWRDAILGFVQWAQPYIQAFLGFFSGLWEQHGGTITAIVNTLFNGLKQIFGGAFSILKNIVRVFFGLLRADTEGVKNAVMSIFDTLVGGVVDLFTWLYNMIIGNSIIPDLVNGVTNFITSLKDGIIGLIDTLVSTIVGSAQWLLDRYISLFTMIYDNTYGRLFSLKDDAIRLVGNLASGAVDLVVGLKDDVTRHITRTKDNVVGIFTDVKNAIVGAGGIVPSLVGGVVDSLSDLGGKAGGMFKSAFNGAIPNRLDIPSVTIPNPLPGESGWTVGGGSLDLPQLDTGGMIRSTGAAILHEGEEVIRAAEVDRGGGSGGAGDVFIEIFVDGSKSPEATARAIDRKLSQANIQAWRS